MNRIGRKIKLLRRTRGFSQDELARRARVTQKSISKIETGVTKNPRGLILKKIGNVFEVSVDYLCGPTKVLTKPESRIDFIVNTYQGVGVKERIKMLEHAREIRYERRSDGD